MKKFIGIFILLACFVPLRVSANDGFAAEGVGGVTIAKTNIIAIKNEVLDVSCDRIHVSYDFVNESDHDEDAVIMFPLPDYPASYPESGGYYAGQPADFTITVDGKPVKFRTEVRALMGDIDWVDGKRKLIHEVDVTDKLKAAGLSEKEIAHFRFNTKYVKGKREEEHWQYPIPKSKIQQLVKAGLMDGGNMGDSTPQWENRVTYIWKQRFPANKVVHVEHSYRPFTSGGANAGYSEYYDSKQNEFCLSNENITTLNSVYKNKKNLDSYNNVPGTNIEYILTTANSWKDGIRDFTLRIHPKSNNEVVSACIPAKITKVSNELYQVHIENFHPVRELSVYFGNALTCDGDSSGVPPKIQ